MFFLVVRVSEEEFEDSDSILIHDEEEWPTPEVPAESQHESQQESQYESQTESQHESQESQNVGQQESQSVDKRKRSENR